MTMESPSTDLLHRFSFSDAPIRGQWVRLGPAVDEIFALQPYPPAVRGLLGQMLGAVALLAGGIKFAGAVTIHSRGEGPLTMVMAECRSQQLLRGIARWDRSALLPESVQMRDLIGNGQLAISLLPDQRAAAQFEDADEVAVAQPSYQGLIGLEHGSFAENLEAYFATSEQLPSRLFFASQLSSQLSSQPSRVTGLLLQRMPAQDDANEIELDQHAALWEEVCLLATTITEAELSAVPARTLLARLFNSHAINLQPARRLRFECTCNREKTATTLRTLSRPELFELLEAQGEITVTCEVCGQAYRYDRVDTHQLLEPGNPRIH